MDRLVAVPLAADMATRFHDLGTAIIEYALTEADILELDRGYPELETRAVGATTARIAPDAVGWLRNHTGLTELAARLGRAPKELASATAADKTGGASWFAPWHQDRGEAAPLRPVGHLNRTLSLRVHLDACSEDDGPLEVVPGTHTSGPLDGTAIAALVARKPAVLCLAARGDIVALRPLVVRRAQRARKPVARRIVLLEYRSVAALTS